MTRKLFSIDKEHVQQTMGYSKKWEQHSKDPEGKETIIHLMIVITIIAHHKNYKTQTSTKK